MNASAALNTAAATPIAGNDITAWFDANRGALAKTVANLAAALTEYDANAKIPEPRMDDMNARLVSLENAISKILRRPDGIGAVAMALPAIGMNDVKTWRDVTADTMKDSIDVPFLLASIDQKLPINVKDPIAYSLVAAEAEKLGKYLALFLALKDGKSETFLRTLAQMPDDAITTDVLKATVDIAEPDESAVNVPWCTAAARLLPHDVSTLRIIVALIEKGAPPSYADLLLGQEDWPPELLVRYLTSATLRTGTEQLLRELTAVQDGETTPLLQIMRNDVLFNAVMDDAVLPNNYMRAQLMLRGANALRTDEAQKLHTYAMALLDTYIPTSEGVANLNKISAIWRSDDGTSNVMIRGKTVKTQLPAADFDALMATFALAHDWLPAPNTKILLRVADIAALYAMPKDIVSVIMRHAYDGAFFNLSAKDAHALLYKLRKNTQFQNVDNYATLNTDIVSAYQITTDGNGNRFISLETGDRWVNVPRYEQQDASFSSALNWVSSGGWDGGYYNPKKIWATRITADKGIFLTDYKVEILREAGVGGFNLKWAKSAPLLKGLTQKLGLIQLYSVFESAYLAVKPERITWVNRDKKDNITDVGVDGFDTQKMTVDMSKEDQIKIVETTKDWPKNDKNLSMNIMGSRMISIDPKTGTVDAYNEFSKATADFGANNAQGISAALNKAALFVTTAPNVFYVRADAVHRISVNDDGTTIHAGSQKVSYNLTDAARRRLVQILDARNKMLTVAAFADDMPAALRKYIFNSPDYDATYKAYVKNVAAITQSRQNVAQRKAGMCLGL